MTGPWQNEKMAPPCGSAFRAASPVISAGTWPLRSCPVLLSRPAPCPCPQAFQDCTLSLRNQSLAVGAEGQASHRGTSPWAGFLVLWEMKLICSICSFILFLPVSGKGINYKFLDSLIIYHKFLQTDSHFLSEGLCPGSLLSCSVFEC